MRLLWTVFWMFSMILIFFVKKIFTSVSLWDISSLTENPLLEGSLQFLRQGRLFLRTPARLPCWNFSPSHWFRGPVFVSTADWKSSTVCVWDSVGEKNACYKKVSNSYLFSKMVSSKSRKWFDKLTWCYAWVHPHDSPSPILE